MLALETLNVAARIYERIIDAERMMGVDPERGLARLKLAADMARAERPVIAGVISTLEIVERAMAQQEAPAAAVRPVAANDSDHGLSAPSETPPTIA
jgi:hypothetical protein